MNAPRKNPARAPHPHESPQAILCQLHSTPPKLEGQALLVLLAWILIRRDDCLVSTQFVQTIWTSPIASVASSIPHCDMI